jgi:hypothetical protein
MLKKEVFKTVVGLRRHFFNCFRVRWIIIIPFRCNEGTQSGSQNWLCDIIQGKIRTRRSMRGA